MLRFRFVIFVVSLTLLVHVGHSSETSSNENTDNDEHAAPQTSSKPNSKRKPSGSAGSNFNPRQPEIDEFFAKYRESLSKHHDTPSPSFSHDEIRSLLGDGVHLVVFDCLLPSYMDLRRKTHIKSSDILDELSSNQRANCSRDDDNIWHVSAGPPNSFLTYNYKSRTLSISPPLPMSDLVDYFRRLGICNEFMRFVRHPGYFVRHYRKPAVCAATKRRVDAMLNNDNDEAARHGFELKVPPKQKETKFFNQHRQPQRFRYPQGFRNRNPQFRPFQFQRPMGGCIGG